MESITEIFYTLFCSLIPMPDSNIPTGENHLEFSLLRCTSQPTAWRQAQLQNRKTSRPIFYELAATAFTIY